MKSGYFKYVFIILIGLLFLTPFSFSADEGIPGGFAGDGIVVGNFVLYPDVEMIYQYEDNLFLEPESKNPQSQGSYVVRPKLQLEMPFWNSYLKVGYTPQYRWYQGDEYELPTPWTHIFQLDSKLRTSSRLSITFRDRFVRGVLETEEFDQNREIARGNAPFKKNKATLGLSYELTNRLSLGSKAEFQTVNFDPEPGQEPKFYNYERFSVSGSMQYRIRPLTKFVFRATGEQTDQDRFTGKDNGFDSWKVQMGLDGNITQTLTGSLFAGYEGSEFDLGNFSNYSGLIVSAKLENQFSPESKLSLTLQRNPSQSAFEGNNYYTSHQASVTATRRISNVVFSSLGLSFQNNDYPTVVKINGKSVERDDDISGVKAGLGLYLRERSSLRVNYKYEDRDSNIPSQCYTNNVYIFQANIGW